MEESENTKSANSYNIAAATYQKENKVGKRTEIFASFLGLHKQSRSVSQETKRSYSKYNKLL